MDSGCFLQGRAVLVTRPAGVAEPLCALIEAAGGEALRFPTLAILPGAGQARAAQLLAPESLARFDLVVFVSPTAVFAAFREMGNPLLDALCALSAASAGGAAVAAVGQGTAGALARRGVADIIVPTRGADSEALAALPPLLGVAGRRVLIVRGEGGRDWLGNLLRERGAEVEYAECYRRELPAYSSSALQAMAERWERGAVHAVAVTSREALDNLLRLFERQLDTVRATPLFAAHTRVAEQARASGMQRVVVCEPGDQAMLAALKAFFVRVE